MCVYMIVMFLCIESARSQITISNVFLRLVVLLPLYRSRGLLNLLAFKLRRETCIYAPRIVICTTNANVYIYSYFPSCVFYTVDSKLLQICWY